MLFDERELRGMADAQILIDEWAAAYRKLYFDYCRLNDRLIDAELELKLAQPLPATYRRSPFDE